MGSVETPSPSHIGLFVLAEGAVMSVMTSLDHRSTADVIQLAPPPSCRVPWSVEKEVTGRNYSSLSLSGVLREVKLGVKGHRVQEQAVQVTKDKKKGEKDCRHSEGL